MLEMQALMKRAQDEAAAIRISGAQGPFGDVINGLFIKTEEGGELVWKQPETKRWLYCWSGKQWWVGNTEFKDKRQNDGWAHSEVMESNLLPMDACKWEVLLSETAAAANKWEEQQLQVRWMLLLTECVYL